MDQTLSNILKSIEKAKGENIQVYKFSTRNPFIDYVVITSASNMRQVNAIAEYVREGLLASGLSFSHIEGNETSKWILVDGGNTIVHIFEETEREVYDLEKLYSQCEKVDIHE